MNEALEFPLLLFLQVEWEDVLAIVGFFGIVITIAVLIYLNRVKSREFMHKERMALVERAEALPENINQLLAGFTPAPDRDLRVGLIWLISGLGSSLVLYLLADSRPYWPAGLIPVFVGLGYLVSFLVLSRRQRGEGDEAQEGKRAPLRQALSGGTAPALPEGPGPALQLGTASEEEKIE